MVEVPIDICSNYFPMIYKVKNCEIALEKNTTHSIQIACPVASKLTLIVKFSYSYCIVGRRGGLMVSALVPGASGPGASWGHCVVFLGKTLNSHSASLHPGV